MLLYHVCVAVYYAIVFVLIAVVTPPGERWVLFVFGVLFCLNLLLIWWRHMGPDRASRIARRRSGQ